MRAIFISYRREDAEGQAGRLFDDLARHFGQDSVFMDVAGLEPGRDFRRAIDQHVASCCVLLAMIGKGWIDAKDASGRRRLDDVGDFVRLETASALKRDIPVIPVLVHGAQMPRPDQLPPDLVELAYRNGVELTHARWDSDVRVLIAALGPYVESSRQGGASAPADAPPRPVAPPKSVPPATWSGRLVAVGAAAAIALALGGIALYQQFAEGTEAEASSTLASDRVSLVGTWAPSPDCPMHFLEDDGTQIKGSCDTPIILHRVTGTYEDPKHVRITITRTDTRDGCTTTVAGKIEILRNDAIEMSSEGWHGCKVSTGPVKTLLSRS